MKHYVIFNVYENNQLSECHAWECDASDINDAIREARGYVRTNTVYVVAVAANSADDIDIDNGEFITI